MRCAAAWLAALVLLLVGCRTPVTVPRGALLAADDPRVKVFLGQLERRAEERRSMWALARLSLDTPDLRFRRPQRVVAERPDRLRVETLGLFDQVVAALVTADGYYQLYDVGSRTFEQGLLTPELLWRVARVELRAEEVVELLLGAPGPGPGAVVAGAWEFEDGSVAIELADEVGAMWRHYGFDATGRLRHMMHFGEDGDLSWEASFDDYRELAGVPFAFRLDLDFARLRTRATFSFKSAELNPNLPGDVFVLKLPEHSAP